MEERGTLNLDDILSHFDRMCPKDRAFLVDTLLSKAYSICCATETSTIPEMALLRIACAAVHAIEGIGAD